MQTPIIKTGIEPFDAKFEYELEFYADSEKQIAKNQLIIEDNFGNEVYNNTIRSYVYTHTIPANTLNNGGLYKAKVRVQSATGDWSNFSPYEVFKCLSPAKVTVDNIDYENGNKIYNQNITFTATYEQSEGEKPALYRFKLYDKTGVLLRAYDEKVYKDTISQTVEDLEDSVTYSLEVVVKNNSGRVDTSGLVEFVPSYETTSLSAVLDPINKKEEGAIELRSRLTQIKGKLYDANGELIDEDLIEYVDDEMLDMLRDDYDVLVYDEGFKIDDIGFTLKLWIKNPINTIPNKDKPIMKLISDTGSLNLYLYNDKFHLFKLSDSSVEHYTHIGKVESSNVFVNIVGNKGTVDIKQKSYEEGEI